MAEDYKDVVKNGNYYHLYGAGTDNPTYRYVRPSSRDHTIKPISAIGSAPTRTGVSSLPSVDSHLNFSQPGKFVAPQVNAGNPNPMDAGYFTDIGKLDTYFQNRQSDIQAAIAQAQANAQLTLQGIAQSRTEANQSSARANRDIGMAFETLAHNKPIDIRNQTNASNKSGLLYSGFQNEALGNIKFQYGQKEQGLTNQKADVAQQLANQLARLALQETGTKQDLASALAGYQRQQGELTANYGLDRQSALQTAIQRQLERDQTAAQLGAGTTASGSSSPSFRAIPYTSPSGRRGVLHIYPDGRRVFVPRGGLNQI